MHVSVNVNIIGCLLQAYQFFLSAHQQVFWSWPCFKNLSYSSFGWCSFEHTHTHTHTHTHAHTHTCIYIHIYVYIYIYVYTYIYIYVYIYIYIYN